MKSALDELQEWANITASFYLKKVSKLEKKSDKQKMLARAGSFIMVLEKIKIVKNKHGL